MKTDADTGHNEEQKLDELYREVVFEHYRRPRNKEALPDAEIVAKGYNPLCGDKITVYGELSAAAGEGGKGGKGGKRFQRICFDGQGCAICIASASLMTETVRGKTTAEAEEMADDFKAMLRDEKEFVAPENMPDLEALVGVKKFPVRVKCATLAWTTLKNGILKWRGDAAGEKVADDE